MSRQPDMRRQPAPEVHAAYCEPDHLNASPRASASFCTIEPMLRVSVTMFCDSALRASNEQSIHDRPVRDRLERIGGILGMVVPGSWIDDPELDGGINA